MIVSESFDIQQLTAGMNELGWVLWGNNEPPLVHLTVDAAADSIINHLLADLGTVTKSLLSGKTYLQSESAVYGTGVSDEEDRLPRWSYNAWNLIRNRECS